MVKSSESIIEHIVHFLEFCKKEGFAEKTQENYKRYLNRFILWLKKESKNNLLPHNLTTNDIESFRAYLANCKGKKGNSLKKISQNYYLIALRALLGYFIVKNIISLLPDKVLLPRGLKREKNTNFLNIRQIERLLAAPDAKTPQGLRDKALLATIISSGFKIAQLKNLNRDDRLEQNIPGETISLIKEYLKTREDKSEALFINYRSRKNADKRLTVRSIERIINKYGRQINLPFFITPEILRWSHAIALLNKEVMEIKENQTHQIIITESYEIRNLSSFNQKKLRNLSPSPTWNNIENLINQEINWLKNNIPVLPEGYKENPAFLKCDDCILRKIAILIISRRVTATEIKATENKDLWNGLTKNMNFKKISRHGKEWHKKMMNAVLSYFDSLGYQVNTEPFLHYGRTDLGIFMRQYKRFMSK